MLHRQPLRCYDSASRCRNPTIVGVAGTLMLVLLSVYALKAFRTVSQTGWGWTLIKSAAIAPRYFGALAVTVFATFLWTVLI